MLPTQHHDRILEANAREYGPLFNYINWVGKDQARAAMGQRSELLRTPGLSVSCRGTKIHHGPLSPGCKQCAAMSWSCLFISGRCNGRCFYCPTPQNTDDPPMSASVPFTQARDYANYVRFFGYGGASISGGEPFLEFEKSLEYVRNLRLTCGPDLHIWIYTNGTLVTEDTLRRLTDAGLDEIRFDIGATEYDLRHVRRAQGIVPTVTVEIPSVPEEHARLKGLLPELTATGVSHLNLHQLRLTPHNARHLLERDYTYIHGPKVTVLESELCALDLVAYGARSKLPLAINYCSFVYKYRFQAAASRKRFGAWAIEVDEELTENGHIRTIFAHDDSSSPLQPVPLHAVSDRPADQRIRVSYAATFLRHQENPKYASHALRISDTLTVWVERHPVQELLETDVGTLRERLLSPVPDRPHSENLTPAPDESYEWITPDLGEYGVWQHPIPQD